MILICVYLRLSAAHYCSLAPFDKLKTDLGGSFLWFAWIPAFAGMTPARLVVMDPMGTVASFARLLRFSISIFLRPSLRVLRAFVAKLYAFLRGFVPYMFNPLA